MRSWSLLALLVASVTASLAALVAGCGGEEGARQAVGAQAAPDAATMEESGTTVFGTTAEAGQPGATVGVAPAAGEDERASEDPAGAGAFGAGPRADGGSGYEADRLSAVRHGLHEGYERVVLDLGTGEEPAREVPGWTLESPEGDGRLRVTLSSVGMTGVSDGGFEDSEFLESFYVVRAPDGGVFVDVFSRSAFVYRVVELSGPARLVVDFRPTDTDLAYPLPVREGNTVLVRPREGELVDGSLAVSGYSRNFEAANTVILEGSDGEELLRETVPSNDWTETWGYFEATVDAPPFSGPGTLRVGAESSRDGGFEGVEVPVYGG